jgi:hypothetical protein
MLENCVHAGSTTISTDTKGILAGRIKRRWLIDRKQQDWERAYQLYLDAFNEAKAIREIRTTRKEDVSWMQQIENALNDASN